MFQSLLKVKRYFIISTILFGSILSIPYSASAVLFSDLASATLSPYPDTASQSQTVFLPILSNNYTSNRVLLGVSPTGYVGDQSVIDNELKALDNWAGKSVSVVGFFMNIQEHNPRYDIHYQFETLYQNGYTGFLNLMTDHQMYKIARGDFDSNIRDIAKAYAEWSSLGPNRMAFIAPFPEMNGDWYIYGEDPTNFKIAYKRIMDIFTEEGVTPEAVRWVFAPNGWSQIPFEEFYPGHSLVDVFAFSSYNYGYCDAIDPWQRWVMPEEIYGPYLDRFNNLNPNTPVFIAQTASTSRTSGGYSEEAKNLWLIDAYNYLASKPNMKAILYFNIEMECDWPIFTPNGSRYDGYKNAVQDPSFIYLPPDELAQYDLSP